MQGEKECGLAFVVTWVDLEGVVPTGVSQAETRYMSHLRVEF